MPTRRALLCVGLGVLAGCAPAAPRPPHPPAQESASSSPPTPTASSLASASPTSPRPSGAPAASASPTSPAGLPSRADIVAEFGGREAGQFGMELAGVVLRTASSSVCLTFDACGGQRGSQLDEALIGHLEAAHVPATLFLNSRFIDANPERVAELAEHPLFELANHGTRHVPLSVSGRSAYGIAGTSGVGEIYDEVVTNQLRLAQLVARPLPFFRSGTAHVDDVAVAVCERLGIRVVNFDVNADGGATFSPGQVVAALSRAKAGSICIGHCNRPGSGTAQGVRDALRRLLDRGTTFSTLSAAL